VIGEGSNCTGIVRVNALRLYTREAIAERRAMRELSRAASSLIAAAHSVRVPR
jgi:hypothetical protein